MFTVINASLLRPPPAVADPNQLVSVERVQTAPTRRMIAEFSYPDFRDLREQSTTLAGLAGYNGASMALDDAAGSTRAWVSYVSDNFFTVLGVRPVAGRLFAADDTTRAEATQFVVLGHALWQRRYGGSPSVIGSRLKLDGQVFTIIGVAPARFIGAMTRYPMELWIPVAMGSRVSPVAYGLDLSSRLGGRDPLRGFLRGMTAIRTFSDRGTHSLELLSHPSRSAPPCRLGSPDRPTRALPSSHTILPGSPLRC